MTVQDIWQIIARNRRGKGETILAWSVRLCKLAPHAGEPNALEWRSIKAAPGCRFCGAEVFMSDHGRLDVTHDFRMHHPEYGRRSAAPERAPSRRGYGIRDVVGGLVYGRDP